jgi:hypothetical protein
MNKVAPRKLSCPRAAADELTDDAAGALAQRRRSSAGRQAAAREQHQREPPMRTAVLTRVRPLLVALPEHHEARDAEHDGE